jgi:phosphatidylglycerophosphate synthase
MTSTLATPPTFRGSLKSLRHAQKSNVGAPGYSRWVNRPLGRILSSAANVVGATPNQVTMVSAAFSAAALVLVAVLPPSFAAGVLITALLLGGYALDSADGQLARLRGGGSLAGEWLDHVVDCAKTASVHLVVLISWFRFFDMHVNTTMLLIPIAFTVVSCVWFFAVILTDLLRRSRTTTGVRPAQTGGTKVARSIMVLPADFGVLALSFVLLGSQPAFIAVYTLLVIANAIFLAGKLLSWFREMRAIDATA